MKGVGKRASAHREPSCILRHPNTIDPSSQRPSLESRRSVSDEGRADLGDAMGQGELELGGEELLDVCAADILSLLNFNHTKNVDRPETSTVTSSHILIEAFHRIRTGELAELLVHVVCTRARIISDPDTEDLNLQGLLLVNNIDTNNLSIGFLDFLQLTEEVPETRLRNDFIGRKDAHTVDLGGRLSLGGQMTADDLKLLERHFVDILPL